jgi:hypothetical protein
MRISMKNTICLISILLFILPAICLAQGPTAAEYGVVLNLSGKQRMLTQKMSKEMMLIALNHEAELNQKNLAATSSLFDKTLKGLRDGDRELQLPPTVSKRIIKQLDKINTKYWQGYHGLVKIVLAKQKVTKEQVTELSQANLPLLKQMNKCVKLYEKDASKAGLKSDPGLAVTINLSEKQRMLTQKMSKEFLLIAYGHEVADNKLNLMETANLFDRTLLGLMDGDETLDLPGTKNEKIRGQLKVVMELWRSFKPIIDAAIDPKSTTIKQDQIARIAESNLPLLREMNKAVGMYEKEAAK